MLHYLLNHKAQSLVTIFFEELLPVEVGEIIAEGFELKPNPDMFFKEVDLTLPLRSRLIRSLQAKDAKTSNILQQLQLGDLPTDIYLRGWHSQKNNCGTNR